MSLVRAMEAGYDDYQNIRADPDIAPLRADARFEGIVARFEPQGALEGLFAMLSKGTTGEQRKAGGAPKGGGGGAHRRALQRGQGEDEEVTRIAVDDAKPFHFCSFLFTSMRSTRALNARVVGDLSASVFSFRQSSDVVIRGFARDVVGCLLAGAGGEAGAGAGRDA